MTDEEADAFDEIATNTIPTLGRNGTGFFSKKGFQVIFLDDTTARILNAKAMATRHTPSELVAELVHERLLSAG